jgi:hypothetical protein
MFFTNEILNWTCYSLDGKDNATVAGKNSLAALPNGLHNITVYYKDKFGNIGRFRYFLLVCSSSFILTPREVTLAANPRSPLFRLLSIFGRFATMIFIA